VKEIVFPLVWDYIQKFNLDHRAALLFVFLLFFFVSLAALASFASFLAALAALSNFVLALFSFLLVDDDVGT